MVECSAIAVLKFLIFEYGTLHFHVALDPGNPHHPLSMGISLSRLNSSPTRDSLPSSISVGVMAIHTTQFLVTRSTLCLCWPLTFCAWKFCLSHLGYELTGSWGEAISAGHEDVGQRIIYRHVASLLPNCKFLGLSWCPPSTPSLGSVRWQFNKLWLASFCSSTLSVSDQVAWLYPRFLE